MATRLGEVPIVQVSQEEEPKATGTCHGVVLMLMLSDKMHESKEGPNCLKRFLVLPGRVVTGLDMTDGE